MSGALRETLGAVAAVPGVRAALLATEAEGLAAEAVATWGVDPDALAAFATALFRRTRLANEAAGYGATQHLALDAAGGRVFVTARGELALVVLADRDAAAGPIRVAMARAARAIA